MCEVAVVRAQVASREKELGSLNKVKRYTEECGKEVRVVLGGAEVQENLQETKFNSCIACEKKIEMLFASSCLEELFE